MPTKERRSAKIVKAISFVASPSLISHAHCVCVFSHFIGSLHRQNDTKWSASNQYYLRIFPPLSWNHSVCMYVCVCYVNVAFLCSSCKFHLAAVDVNLSFKIEISLNSSVAFCLFTKLNKFPLILTNEYQYVCMVIKFRNKTPSHVDNLGFRF